MRYLSGTDLIKKWQIEGFELFECMAKGLQPYSKYGKKIIDLGTLELKRKWSEDEILKWLRIEQGAHNTQFVGGVSRTGKIKKKLTDDELRSAARCEYFKQPTDTPVIPDGCIAVDLNLSLDEAKAVKQIKDAMEFRFKMKDVKEFETNHGVHIVPEHPFSNATNDSLYAFVNVAPESVIEKNLKGIDLLKRWKSWGIVPGQMLKFIKDGALPAYWYDGRKVIDKKSSVIKKFKVIKEETNAIKKGNPHLQDQEIKKLVFERGQEMFPNLPWDINNFYLTNLTLPKYIKSCNHDELDKIEETLEEMKYFFLFRESDVLEFEKREFLSNQERDSEHSKIIDESKQQGTVPTVLNHPNCNLLPQCVNLSKLQSSASVWAEHFSSSGVQKISFFNADEKQTPYGIMNKGPQWYRKKYVLLFELAPPSEPDTDAAYVICNSFSQYEDGFGARAGLLETDLKDRPEKEKPFGYIREWRIFVRLGTTYFEKCYDSTVTFQVRSDISDHGITTWEELDFKRFVVEASETILFSRDSLIHSVPEYNEPQQVKDGFKSDTGTSLREIGRTVAAEVEKYFETKVNPGTIFQKVRRIESDTNVSPTKNPETAGVDGGCMGGAEITPKETPVLVKEKILDGKLKNEIDYSIKPKSEQAYLAHEWSKTGMTAEDIIKRLYKKDYESGNVKLESLKRNLRRLKEAYPQQ